MNNTIRVGTLFGIPFYVHPSWFLILALVTFSSGNGLAHQFPNLAGGLPWIWGFLTAILMFASVLAHELGHSWVAIQRGIEVKSITLFLFGGLANLDREPKTPGEAFWVAIAGPIVSLLLFFILTFASVGTGLSGFIANILGVLASVNLALALFNLIPGLPLDGGNILKAAIWKVTGNPYKGVIFAGKVGQLFGVIAMISGLFGNFWNVIIGWFLWQNASQFAQSAKVQNQLQGFNAIDAISSNSPIISETVSLREFANDYVIGKNTWRQFLVINSEGKLQGVLKVDDLKSVSTSQWPQVLVKELTQPLAISESIKPEQSLLEVATLLEQLKVQELPVINAEGIVLGILEKTTLIRLLQTA